MRKLALGALGVLCFTTLLVVMVPTASAVTIDSFSAPFNAVLDNLMTNYWSPADNGDWLYDEYYPCGGYDGPQFSAELLYPLALDTGNALYTERANKTVDFVIDLVDPLSELVQRVLNGEDVQEETAGAPALIYAHGRYSGSSQYDFDTNIPAILLLAGQLLRQGYSFDPLNDYGGPGAVAFYQLRSAYSFRDEGLLDQVSTLVRDAHGLLELADAYWVQVDEDTGYYAASGGPDGRIFNSGWMLEALSLAYGASGKDLYLDRARDLLSYLESYWDDTFPYGYCESPACTVKILSSNHAMCRGLLMLYDATGDPVWLDRAHEVLLFMTDPVVSLMDDPRFPGYSVFSHDWSAYTGPSDCSCSGCNFTVLTAIYMYNRLEQEGPGGLDRLANCDDGVDNDGDGLVDHPNDRGCTDASDSSERDPTLICDDGVDNDGDTLIDYPDDPGCYNSLWVSENPQCMDGVDNDGDGLIDHPDDPACASAFWFTETSQCQNGIDDDGDGRMDYDAGLSVNGHADPDGPDPECVGNPARLNERCGLGAELALLLPPLMWVWRRRRRRI